MQTVRLFLFLFLPLLLAQSLSANGIKGTISDTNGNPLPFATIFVKEIGTGTSSNATGVFSYRLPNGRYTITFQYIGYESLVKEVTIANAYVELDIQLKDQTYELKTVEVTIGGKDPAYIIMRKAIAKAPFHLNQLDSYTAEVYTKGSGRLKKSPFLLRKMMEKEGIDSSFAFVSESVSEVTYKRPNYFKEKIISVYTTGDDQDSSPNEYVNASFYNSTVAEVISPLSPKAFAYYNFTYEGFFMDRGQEIDKIKITPKSKGENVATGYINIIEGDWNIHSLDIEVQKVVPVNMLLQIKQIYAPIEEKVWLPVTHQFDGRIKVFGFNFEFGYLATVSDYQIELNPDLDYEVAVIDEKLEAEEAKSIEKETKQDYQEIEERLQSEKKVTRKELRKLLKEYEKEEQAQQEEPEVVSIQQYEVDSNAYKRDSIYWTTIRPIPLSELEVRGYEVMDSLNTVEEEKEDKETDETVTVSIGSNGSSISKKKNKFSLPDIVLGGSYGKKGQTQFYIKPMVNTIQFNTVDGYNFEYGLGLERSDTLDRRLFIEGTTRYGFARKKLNYWGTIGYDFGGKLQKREFRISAGNGVSQYNSNEPIHPLVNTVTTLFFEQNYMKLYEKDFAKASYLHQIHANTTFELGAEWSQRRTLANFSTHHWFDKGDRNYTSNIPISLERVGDFDAHEAFIATLNINTRPWQKYRIRNGKKIAIQNTSPLLSFAMRQGIKGVGESSTNFSHIELGAQHHFQLGIKGKVDVKANIGFFGNQEEMQFPDYQHFLANETPFVTTDPVGSFRLLDYYKHSTNDVYVNAHVHYQFRKFLASQILEVQLLGIKENVFINYLGTDTSDQYFEAGYSLDNIFRIFRLEFITSFQNWKYQDFGVRIGIATNLNNVFN